MVLARTQIPGGAGRGRLYLSLHCHHQNDSQIDCREKHATLTSGLPLGSSEALRSLRHYLRAQSQGHHAIDRLEERGVERGKTTNGATDEDERVDRSRTRTIRPMEQQTKTKEVNRPWTNTVKSNGTMDEE